MKNENKRVVDDFTLSRTEIIKWVNVCKDKPGDGSRKNEG